MGCIIGTNVDREAADSSCLDGQTMAPRGPAIQRLKNHQNHIGPLQGRLEGGREGDEERGSDGVTVANKDGGRREAPLTDSLNMESDSTFQQIEDIEEIF